MTQAITKRPVGRPPLDGGSTQVALRMPQRMLAEIEAIVAERMDSPDRADVIRQLIAEALEARKRKSRA